VAVGQLSDGDRRKYAKRKVLIDVLTGKMSAVGAVPFHLPSISLAAAAACVNLLVARGILLERSFLPHKPRADARRAFYYCVGRGLRQSEDVTVTVKASGASRKRPPTDRQQAPRKTQKRIRASSAAAEPAPAIMQEWMRVTDSVAVTDIASFCEALGLPRSGSKRILLERLIRHDISTSAFVLDGDDGC